MHTITEIVRQIDKNVISFDYMKCVANISNLALMRDRIVQRSATT